VAERFGAYPFEIERLAESLDRLLLAVSSLWEAGEGEEGTEAAPDAPDASLRARLGALRVMVRAGFDEAAATLTLVPGIGPELARRLARAGVGDIEALAQADPAQVAASVRGVRAGRAARWVEAAEKLVAGGASAFGFRDAEGAGRADGPVTGAGWTAAGVDPYRLRRALDLRVTGAEGGVFRVAGGTEPHLVQITPGGGYACDCVDAAKGTALCKHVLAVRLWRGDDGLRELAARLRSEPDRRAEGPLDLFALWMEGHARAWGGGA
jgi:helicase